MMVVAAADPIGDFINRNPAIAVVAFLAFFTAISYLALRFSAWMTGWAELAEHYHTAMPFQGETWRFQSAQMRYLTHYNGCLTFGVNEMGMYAAGWGPVRWGAPPLLVPWGEFTITPKKRFVLAGYELRFHRSPDVYMWVRASLGEKLVRAGSGQASGIRMAPPIG